ncbi:hypothetical protein R8Z50_22330 [Longispora sp. K20-0274]|uniref:hypothetical protein n=1 Tax=Longispora sp. K20-0274 TaxID=3088255 RepID=UPI00399B81DA
MSARSTHRYSTFARDMITVPGPLGTGVISVYHPGTGSGELLVGTVPAVFELWWTPQPSTRHAVAAALVGPHGYGVRGVLAIVVVPDPEDDADDIGVGDVTVLSLAAATARSLSYLRLQEGAWPRSSLMCPRRPVMEQVPGWTWVPHLITAPTDIGACEYVVWEFVSDDVLAITHDGPLPDLATRLAVHAHADTLVRLRTDTRLHADDGAIPDTAAGLLAVAYAENGLLDIHTAYTHAPELLPVLGDPPPPFDADEVPADTPPEKEPMNPQIGDPQTPARAATSDPGVDGGAAGGAR